MSSERCAKEWQYRRAVTVHVKGNYVSSEWDINLSVALFFQTLWGFFLFMKGLICVFIYFILKLIYFTLKCVFNAH